MRTLARLLCVLCALCGSVLAQEREAFTVTRYDLRVQVNPQNGAFAVGGRLTLRNDSLLPQRSAVLQISSTLEWDSITLAGAPAKYTVRALDSGIDHTGSVREALVDLGRVVAPQATVELDVSYSGTIPHDARRYTAVGAPLALAEASDWDQVSAGITAFRGVGYVAWYPVAIEPVSIAQPQDFFARLGDWKQRHARSAFAADLCFNVPVPAGFSIVTSGTAAPASSSSSTHGKCAAFDFDLSGFHVPVVAAAPYGIAERPHATAYYYGQKRPAALDLLAAFEQVQQALAAWFTPARRVVFAEQPEAAGTPYESGTFVMLRYGGSRRELRTALARQVAHAGFQSPRLWLDHGVAEFAQALEREHMEGRAAALAFLALRLPVIHASEAPAAPGDLAAAALTEPLVTTTNDVFYRYKAAYVWWMLRDLVGDAALQRALAAYRPADDKEPSYIQRLLERESKQDLEWFFGAWVYRDRGLPEFRVAQAYARPMLGRKEFGLVVKVENTGAADAEVPVVIRTAAGEQVERVRVPGGGSATAQWTVAARPLEVTVNDGSVPEQDPANNTFKVELPVDDRRPTTEGAR